MPDPYRRRRARGYHRETTTTAAPDETTTAARVGSGASTDISGPFTLDDACAAALVTLAGAQAEFPVGATVRHLDGLRLDGAEHEMIVYSAESDNGQTFAVTWRNLRLENGTLTEVAAGSGTAHQGDELFTTAGTLDTTSL